MKFLSPKLIVILIAVLIVLGVSWTFLKGNTPKSATLLTSQALSNSTSEGSVDSDLVSTLLQLRAVTLSGTILSDAAFQSLKDFGTQIILEPVGRDNPFASYAATTTANTSSNAHASQLFKPGAPNR